MATLLHPFKVSYVSVRIADCMTRSIQRPVLVLSCVADLICGYYVPSIHWLMRMLVVDTLVLLRVNDAPSVCCVVSIISRVPVVEPLVKLLYVYSNTLVLSAWYVG